MNSINERIELLKSKLSDFRSTLSNVFQYKVLNSSFVEMTTELDVFTKSLDEIDSKSLSEDTIRKHNYLKFDWSLDAIDLGILLRDSLVVITNRQLTNFSIHDRVSEDEKFDKNIVISESLQAILMKALTETEITLNATIPESKPEWKHQKSPAKIISEQLTELIDQQKAMANVHEKLVQIIPSFNGYREHLLEYNKFRLSHLRSLQNYLIQAKELILEQPEHLELTQLTTLSKSMQKISAGIENEKVISLVHSDFLTGVGELEVPIFADGGELYYRSIDLDKNVEHWTDSEILPKILDADADISNLYDSTLISIFNTRNKIESLGLSDEKDIYFDKEPLVKTIDGILHDVMRYFDTLEDVIFSLNVHTASELKFENIFDKEKEFLPELGFINLSKLRGQKIWYQTNLWNEIKGRSRAFLAKNKIPFVNSLTADPYQFIESKELTEHELDSNSLFLKKGYLGRSFYIPRENVESKILETFDRWQNGFQGSVLLKGDYGSGKSCLIEFMPHLLTEVKVVQINLHTQIQLSGRKHTVTSKLSDTISFIAKQSITTPVVACIDDLEKWQNSEQSMYNTVRDLVDGIAKYGRRIFFVVSTNHFMLQHIERMFDFRSRFATMIETDKMFQNSIANALVIRHNASIKDYNEDDNEALGKKALKISRKNNYNIGASMLAWEKSITSDTDENMQSPPSFNQIVSEHKQILAVILTNKLLKESHLRQGLSTTDNNYISEELRKLRGFKIVSRTFDGFLQISPTIVYHVEQALKNKQ